MEGPVTMTWMLAACIMNGERRPSPRGSANRPTDKGPLVLACACFSKGSSFDGERASTDLDEEHGQEPAPPDAEHAHRVPCLQCVGCTDVDAESIDRSSPQDCFSMHNGPHLRETGVEEDVRHELDERGARKVQQDHDGQDDGDRILYQGHDGVALGGLRVFQAVGSEVFQGMGLGRPVPCGRHRPCRRRKVVALAGRRCGYHLVMVCLQEFAAALGGGRVWRPLRPLNLTGSGNFCV